MPGPSWLTGWVKLNNKHVVYHNNGGDAAALDKKQRAPRTLATSSTCDTRGDPELATTSSNEKRRGGRRSRRRLAASQKPFRSSSEYDVTKSGGEGVCGAVTVVDEKVAVPARVDSPRAVADSNRATPPHCLPLQATEEEDDNVVLGGLSNHSQLSQSCSIPRTVTVASSPAPLPPPAGSRGLGGLLTHPFFTGEQGHHHQQPDPPCPTCVDLDAQLMAALDDLEYMRGIALKFQSEALSSGKKPLHMTAKPLGQNGVGAPIAPVDSSKQLQEVIARHQKQVEQLTKERFRWQQEMHLKLNKFAGLCKNLNEESAVRNRECMSLREDLDRVESERNAASEELLILRAQVAQHEREKVEFAECQAQLRELEVRDVESRKAIQSRDATIHELSSKLEETLDQLEKKEKQARRR